MWVKVALRENLKIFTTGIQWHFVVYEAPLYVLF